MSWEWVLNDVFLELSFRNGMKTADGVTPVLEATALYKPSDEGQLDGTWYDTRGVVQPLKGQTNNATLTVHWGTPETEEGRTVYQVTNDGTVVVEDSVMKDGAWVTFGEATYRRP